MTRCWRRRLALLVPPRMFQSGGQRLLMLVVPLMFQSQASGLLAPLFAVVLIWPLIPVLPRMMHSRALHDFITTSLRLLGLLLA